MSETISPALSHYLAFRYLPSPFLEWAPGVRPDPALPQESNRTTVKDADELVYELRAALRAQGDFALLLSGGIDSAILAAVCPPDTLCLTIDFGGDADKDEVAAASSYTKLLGLEHQIVTVAWQHYEENLSELFSLKRSPMHAIEPALFQVGLAIKDRGLRRVVVGNGADSSFGGMDKLMTHSAALPEFQKRYEFVNPAEALVSPSSTKWLFEAFQTTTDEIDIMRFLREAHGSGIVRSFLEPLSWAGIAMSAPYEGLSPAEPITADELRLHGPKPLLREAFAILYPDVAPRPKVPFARPSDIWLADWEGPADPRFRKDWKPNTGEAKWLAYCADQFLKWLEEG